MSDRPTTAAETRAAFLDFFREKGHEIVPSAPLVPQDDPTLMFINAGMNPFKDVFLGTGSRPYTRVADTQKCLRVSGKHNDLDEVGVDTYHHTFFEMLGNWSFGDYFKEDAIKWAWELLVDRWGLDPARLYATVHEGDAALGLDPDQEAADLWAELTTIPPSHILFAPSKDNFWMMGDTGPCGPCSEIHVDLRPDAERAHVPGQELVNKDDPRVIEIWNLVFIQYNAALADAQGGQVTTLEPLAAQHVDTGMGFERLVAVLNGVSSTYDTDLFAPLLARAAELAGMARGYHDLDAADPDEEATRIALRVVADHVRTLVFAIADGAQPSNTGRGYVIRRILRRAVRYGYQGLGIREPFLHTLAETVVETMGEAFPEIRERADYVTRVVRAEEEGFLRTLESGLALFAEELAKTEGGTFSGDAAFLLHDTYGFPSDLTDVMAREKGLTVDHARFDALMQEQKDRARAAGSFKQDLSQVDAWDAVHDTPEAVAFVGYDRLDVAETRILRARTVGEGDEARHEVVLAQTPFYAESGGQVGDTGTLTVGGEVIQVVDTVKDAEGAIVHVLDKAPADREAAVSAQVDPVRRRQVERHHTATHLLHRALREALGDHVEQKGSLVAPDRLRFDFSHFEKLTDAELRRVERRVNEAVLLDLPLGEERGVPLDEAKARGATALFGEKYGEAVRVISFVDEDQGFVSVELCGGTHVPSTARVGAFRLTSEGSVASGVRRVEAVAGHAAQTLLDAEMEELRGARARFGQTPDGLAAAIAALQDEAKALDREAAALRSQAAASGLDATLAAAADVDGVRVATAQIDGADADTLRGLAETARERLGSGGVAVFGTAADGKALLVAAVTDDLTKRVPAGTLVGALARKVGGGGGGRPHLATAGGKNPDGLADALASAADEVRAALAG